MVSKTLFSSDSNEWETPQEFYDQLHNEFLFTLDPCATKESAKCLKYYTKEDNGLEQDWTGERVFCNPPYGKEISKWVEKAFYSNCLTVMLIPARTDTKYFHNFIYKKSGIDIRFIKGRIAFGRKNKLIEELKSVLEYDLDTGSFIWKVDLRREKGNGFVFMEKGTVSECLNHDEYRYLKYKGTVAGCLNHDGYRYLKYKGKKYAEHRLAYLFMHNKLPKFIEHIDGDKSNNLISNLRECSREQNDQNRRKQSNNTSGYKGVHCDKKKTGNNYSAQIRIDKKLRWLGYFKTAKEAALAYDKKAIEAFGEFAYLNFENEDRKFGWAINSAPFPSMVVVFRP